MEKETTNQASGGRKSGNAMSQQKKTQQNVQKRKVSHAPPKKKKKKEKKRPFSRLSFAPRLAQNLSPPSRSPCCCWWGKSKSKKQNTATNTKPGMAGWGSTLGEYQLEEYLGKGGFAQVHRAVDAASSRDVALKIIHKAKLVNDQGSVALP